MRCLLLFLCCAQTLVAQVSCSDNLWNTWYFGEGANLDFNGGTVSTAAIVGNAIDTREGCASICDVNGALLFYTDGLTVWDKNNGVMPNGTGLLANGSSTQAAMIVPTPGSSTTYHVFTTDELGYANGLRYSIVDMSLNGGLGAVTTKNSLLTTPVSEKLTAVMSANGCDVWIVTHEWDSDAFHAFLLTANGMVTVPVTSNVGSVHDAASGISNAVGYLKASPDGSRLACAINLSGKVEIFDFDNASGQVSNAISLTGFTNSIGLEFSPNSDLVYFTTNSRYVHQVDLTAGNPAAVIASTTQVGGPTTNLIFALQWAPDGKIYCSSGNQNKLSVINNPNTVGTGCNFVDNAINLGGKCRSGLPNPVHLDFKELEINASNSSVCVGDDETFSFTKTSCMSNTQWQVLNGLATITSSTDDQADLNFTTSGTEYLVVSVEGVCGMESDTFEIDVQPCSTPPATSCGENQWNNWYFGRNAGVNFNSGTPVAMNDGAMDQSEGVASVSDYNGNLLFYTDGITVWDQNHNVMVGGTGLLGHSSSTQSAFIVPQPGTTAATATTGTYYIFTVDAISGPNQGLHYSRVDMGANPPLGAVSVKNQAMASPVTEKLTAVMHENGCDVWVLVHEWNSDAFHAYLVTSAGVTMTPVVSNVGMVHSNALSGSDNSGTGEMKTAHDGSKVACAIAGDSIIQIFDFDNATGIVSNPVTVSGYHYPFGLEFSPDNTKLYFTWSTSPFRNISQLDLTAANIPASEVLVGGPLNPQPWGLQLGPDGKIYCSKTFHSYLGAINSPNTLGTACNYDDQAVTLAAGTVGNFGLPDGVTGFVSIGINGTDDVCIGDSESYTATKKGCLSNIQWQALNGLATITTSTDDDASITFNTAGTEQLTYTADGPCGVVGDTITITIKDCGNPQPLTVSTSGDTICEGDCFDLQATGTGAGTLTYSWNTGQSGAGPHNVCPTTTTEYIVTITDSTGASVTDTAVVVVTPNSGALTTSGNQTICNGDSVQLVASGGNTYTWSPATGLSATTGAMVWAFPSSTTTYVVASLGACDTMTASLTVSVVPNITAGISNDTIICEGESVDLTASGGTTYAWSPATTLSASTGTTVTATPAATTTYSVTVSSGNCAPATNQVTITVNPAPTVDAGTDQSITEGNSAMLNGTTTGIDYQWSPGTSLSDSTIQNPEATPSVTTTYTLTSTNSDGCTSTDVITITVESLCEALGDDAVFVPSAFSPNGDGVNDVLYARADTACVDLVQFVIYDRWGEKLFETELLTEGWDGNYRNNVMGTAVFKYYLEAKSKEGDDIIKKGSVTLVR